MRLTAAAESSHVIRVQGDTVSEADQHGSLAIRRGKNFTVAAYRICVVDCEKNTWTLDRACCAGQASGLVRKIGSAQEFDGTRILGCFPENHEFGFGGGHALGFEQQVAEVFIATATA